MSNVKSTMTAVSVLLPIAGSKENSVAVLVSPEHETLLRSGKWKVFVNANQNGRMSIKGQTDKGLQFLSHVIHGKPPSGHVIDHIDRNPLNNIVGNLRVASFAQNAQNRSRKPTATGFLGVQARGGKWRSRCNNTNIGTYDTQAEAARAYDSFVFQQYGVFAHRNFPDEQPEPHVPSQQRQRTEDLPRGVFRTRRTNRYRASMGGCENLGSFDSPEEASEAYQAALKKKLSAKREASERVPIDYNIHGCPIVPARRSGDIVAYVKCDEDVWHDLNSGGINLSPDGYPQTRKNGSTILVHRHVMQAIPGSICDHINRDRCDARRENLRFVTVSENLRNTKRPKVTRS